MTLFGPKAKKKKKIKGPNYSTNILNSRACPVKKCA